MLQGEEPDIATVTKLIRKGTIGNVFVPVTCGSAFKNKGVQPLLDTVCAYLPSPVEVPPMKVRQCVKAENCLAGVSAHIRAWLPLSSKRQDCMGCTQCACTCPRNLGGLCEGDVHCSRQLAA